MCGRLRVGKRNLHDGAITSARTLLETVCKRILDEADETYSDRDDLPALYRAVAMKLQIAPSQHTEDAFKRILGGATSVVEGLGSLRNKIGDAHGQGGKPSRIKMPRRLSCLGQVVWTKHGASGSGMPDLSH